MYGKSSIYLPDDELHNIVETIAYLKLIIVTNKRKKRKLANT